MKNIILLSSAVAAALGTAAFIVKKRRDAKAIKNAVMQPVKRSHHRVNAFAYAKQRGSQA